MFEKRMDQVKEYLLKNQYRYKAPRSLLGSEKTSVFIGSGTNVFLDEISEGKFEGKQYSIQPCLRCHNLKEYDQCYKKKLDFFYRSYFEMLGTMEVGALEEAIVGMYCEGIFSSFCIERDNVLVVLPKKFEYLKEYIKNELGIRKIKVEEREKFTKWSYGVPYLSGTGITFYTVYKKRPIQIFDMVEIMDERTFTSYVETGLAIDNFRIFNKEYDCINKVFSRLMSELNVIEKIYYDSLIAVAEIYRALDESESSENIRQRCIREKFLKYVLTFGKKMGKSDEDIVKDIITYLTEYCISNCELEEVILKELKRIDKNIVNILKEYNKYLKKATTIDIDYVKGTLGVLEVWI